MTPTISTAIIGGGALGLAVAYTLLKRGHKDLVLLEKNSAFGLEQSGSNSGVVHAGFLYESGSLMAELCVQGIELLYEFCEKNATPYKRTGKLMVATGEEQEKKLEFYYRRAINNGLQDVEIISGKEIKKLEPCVEAKAALYVKQSGIIDSSSYISGLYKKAAGMHDTPDLLLKGCNVTGIEPKQDHFLIEVEQLHAETRHWQLKCETLINAAGLYALDIARMIHPHMPYQKQYLRGEYYQFNSRKGLFNKMNIYPLPVPIELPGGGNFLDFGTHLTPKVGPDARGKARVAKEILVGPIFREVSDPQDYGSILDSAIFYDSVKAFFPFLEKEDLYKGHTGILGLIKDQTDFMILKDDQYPHCVHLLGMESPALTASLAIGIYVADMIGR